MPDLDDIFEDIFDAAKKFYKKQKRKNKRSRDSEQDEYASRKPDKRERRSSTLPAQTTSRDEPSEPQQVSPNKSGRSRIETININVESSTLREYLSQAASYEKGILELMRNAPTEFNRSRMEELSRYIENWHHSLEALVGRVDGFQQNKVLQRDLREVPNAIRRLEARLEEGVPEKVAQELRRTLSNRQNQLSSLNELAETMQWAEVKVENTVSMLGTLYSQAMMSQSKGQVGNYQRLLAEIEEESLSLSDYVTTLEEIKFG